MKVKMLVEFEVTPVEDEDGEFSENHARTAASAAIYDFFSS